MSKHIHFIGIGGIGMSALAQWHMARGMRVSGSDIADSVVTNMLAEKGADIAISDDEHGRELAADVDEVVYSPAVPADDLERAAARERGIPEKSYPEALGELTRQYKTIAICGTHGKSTTTAMTALMLMEAGLDPTVIVGTRLKELGGSNFRMGGSDWLVIEADEFKKSFLHYTPTIVACLNVEADHLDVYESFDEIKETFARFFTRIKAGGTLVVNGDDPFLQDVQPPEGVGRAAFSAVSPRGSELRPALSVPGQHNLANALAADAVGEVLGIEQAVRTQALGAFTGTWRRFEYKGEFRPPRLAVSGEAGGAKVYDDYAHHPTEVRAALAGARELFPKEKIWCVFQPHQTHRLDALFDDFTRAFQEADEVVVVETYRVPGREEAEPTHTANELADVIATKKSARYAADQDEALSLLKEHVGAGEVVVVMGAGDITQLATKLTK